MIRHKAIRRVKHYFASLFLASFVAVPALAEGITIPSPKVTDFTLENGMMGVVIEDHRAPVITHMVWYRVGSADEAPGKSGIAHFLEHLLFKGTETIPIGAFSKIVAANGGQDNAFTSYDYTAYFQRVASDRLPKMMEMEADRMRNLVLTDEVVLPERDVVLEERRSRTDNNPSAKFREQISAALFMNHGYGVPVIGWNHEIAQLNLKDAFEFYEQYYAPDNAILIVAGDVDPAEVEELAKKHYGPLKPSGVVPFQRPSEPPHLAARRLAMQDARVRQPYVSRVYLTPSYLTAEEGQGEALAVLADLLGSGVSSRFAESMELNNRVAVNTGAYYQGLARDYGRFGIYAVPTPETSLEDLEAKMDEVLTKIIADGPTEEELSRIKAVMLADSIYQIDSQNTMARIYGSALTIGHTIEDIQSWDARIQKVTAEDIIEAAKLLKIEKSVTGHLTAPKKAEESE